ncbi:substrate-binding domain-containing protein [Actinocrispum wychmicini]|uniref:substrate-binding domain-containing protein n=1 Tax=Actinocrispum wychmicini TaxID=1213861 RepID=UPI001051A6A8
MPDPPRKLPRSRRLQSHELSPELPQTPDAVFIANNLMTVGALECLAQQSVRVPEGIGIVGFDVVSWADLVRPSLTTVVQPTYELGCAVCWSIASLPPSRAPSLVTLPTELRDSSLPRSG